MSTIAVSDDSFESEVLKSDKPVLVDFWAEWCGPCKQIGPALEEIATSMSGEITIAKVNIDDNPMTPGKYGVRGIPTLMIVRGGEVVSTKIGAMAKTKIEEWIKETLVSAEA
ncbi:thioredoxin [Hyphobacterium sp.]|uniref:thioredoxin n=1 Tax=Hyphobacterium sp. TaxID=2004662 RepID=UPI0037481E49